MYSIFSVEQSQVQKAQPSRFMGLSRNKQSDGKTNNRTEDVLYFITALHDQQFCKHIINLLLKKLEIAEIIRVKRMDKKEK